MSNIKSGVSRVCITPPLGTAMSGYFSPRYAKGINDDLYATAVAFDDGENKAVVIALDLCGLKNLWWVDDCKKMVSEYCSIPVESIIINCSHTHTGPVVGFDVFSGAENNKVYDDFLMQRIRDVAYLALKDVSPSKFYMANNEAKDIAFMRLFKMKDGSVVTNPGIGNPDIIHPMAEPNETVTLVKI